MPKVLKKTQCEKCEEISKYGKVNEQTGMFEKIRCNKHKEKDDKGIPPPWKKRPDDFKKICEKREYKLVTNKEEWEVGTTEKGQKFKPIMICKEGHTVAGTCINDFVTNNASCFECNGNQPWSERYDEFKEKCEKREYKLVTNKEEWEVGTTEKCQKFKPKMICKEGHVVSGTSIDSFVTNNVGCPICSNSRTEKLVFEYMKSIFPQFEIINNHRPDWLRYNRNLELDIYLPELKLAIEVNGVQHYKYTPYFHDNEEDFVKQEERDEFKKKRCEEENIKMISIHYEYNYKNEEKLIKYVRKSIEDQGEYIFIDV